MRRLLAAFAIIAVLSSDATAEPVESMPSGHMRLITAPGVLNVLAQPPRTFSIPIGSHIFDPATYAILDGELKRLQEVEVRLTAENDSFRRTMKAWQPGWKTLALTLAVGFAGGFYVHSKF